jgi:uncharacterized protein (UPF0332 family)
MADANDLLDVAHHLALTDHPSQAYLRRAVSTAYYALFHLLVSEATLNWKQTECRPQLARAFDHGTMKTASVRTASRMNASALADPALSVHRHLQAVADTFVQLQQARNQADYNTAKQWSVDEVLDQIRKVAEAFIRWEAIRDESAAQEYLVTLLSKRSGLD